MKFPAGFKAYLTAYMRDDDDIVGIAYDYRNNGLIINLINLYDFSYDISDLSEALKTFRAEFKEWKTKSDKKVYENLFPIAYMPASPAPGPRLRGQKGGGERRKTPKSGKSGPLYAKKGETHNNTDFCSFLYFFSRIRTYVLAIAEKNLYISPPKPGTAPKPGKGNVTNL